MNTIPERFDINRHVLLMVDEEKRIINVILLCNVKRAEEIFMKVVTSLAASYKGYEFVAPLFPISKKLSFALYSNPIWKNTNNVLRKRGRCFFMYTARTRKMIATLTSSDKEDVFSMHSQSDFQTVWNLKNGRIFGIIYIEKVIENHPKRS